MSEIEYVLPVGWTISNLSNLLLALESGKRPKGGVRGITSGIPSIGGEHLGEDGMFRFDIIRYVPEDFANVMTIGVIQKRDILIVKDGATTGEASFVSESFPYDFAVVNEHVFIVRLLPDINHEYVFYWIWSQKGKQQILQDFRGAAQGGISTGFISNIRFPLPPLAEQSRIVAKIEELFSSLDKGIESLTTAREQLKVYRQAVLKQAFEGKLTNKNVKDGELPEGWRLMRIDDVAEVSGGITKNAKRDSLKEYPYLRVANVYQNCLDLAKIDYIGASENEVARCTLKRGDILFVEGNGSIDKSVGLQYGLEKLRIAFTKTISLKLDRQMVLRVNMSFTILVHSRGEMRSSRSLLQHPVCIHSVFLRLKDCNSHTVLHQSSKKSSPKSNPASPSATSSKRASNKASSRPRPSARASSRRPSRASLCPRIRRDPMVAVTSRRASSSSAYGKREIQLLQKMQQLGP